MEWFVEQFAPIAIALFGIVVMFGIVWLISHRQDPADQQEQKQAGGSNDSR